jgi:oligopeptide/dipeptide ABC transporter ATP-binding protein
VSGAVLEVRGLSVSYRTPRGRVRALRNVDLTVPEGAIVGLVGESGCGKSTLLAALIGLLDANAEVVGGRIDFEGRDLLTLAPREVRALRGDRISMIFQDPMATLNPVLSIGRQMTDIQFRRKIGSAEKRRRAAEMLRRVGIADAESRLDTYPHQFSGGMCQRISIAMALQSEPALLIADEPTSALDATLEVQILRRLRELQASFGCSILFVSHHLGVIAELCDFVTVMYAGEVVEQGSVRDVFHQARHPYARKLLECDPARIKKRTAELPTVPGDIPDLTRLPEGCIFRERCDLAFERCAREAPALRRVADGHAAACHLLEPALPETADG